MTPSPLARDPAAQQQGASVEWARPDPPHQRIEAALARLAQAERRLRLAYQAVVESKAALRRLRQSGRSH